MKNKTKDFSCQFDPSCITWESSDKVCEKHGPIKWIREDFGNCKECNNKWKLKFIPKK
jgi:hypothetical protein